MKSQRCLNVKVAIEEQHMLMSWDMEDGSNENKMPNQMCKWKKRKPADVTMTTHLPLQSKHERLIWSWTHLFLVCHSRPRSFPNRPNYVLHLFTASNQRHTIKQSSNHTWRSAEDNSFSLIPLTLILFGKSEVKPPRGSYWEGIKLYAKRLAAHVSEATGNYCQCGGGRWTILASC